MTRAVFHRRADGEREIGDRGGSRAASAKREIVSADAFQVYAGLDLLTAKPDEATLHCVPHHLIGTCRLMRNDGRGDVSDKRRWRRSTKSTREGNRAFVVGGSGHVCAGADARSVTAAARGCAACAQRLEQCSEGELFVRLEQLDPATGGCDRSAEQAPAGARSGGLSAQRPTRFRAASAAEPSAEESRGVFLFRDREELYAAHQRTRGIDVRRGSGRGSARGGRNRARPRSKRSGCGKFASCSPGEFQNANASPPFSRRRGATRKDN